MIGPAVITIELDAERLRFYACCSWCGVVSGRRRKARRAGKAGMAHYRRRHLYGGA